MIRGLVIGIVAGWILCNLVAVEQRYRLYTRLWDRWPQYEGQKDSDSHPLWARLVMRILL